MWSSGWLKSRHVVCSKRLSYCWTIRHLPCFSCHDRSRYLLVSYNMNCDCLWMQRVERTCIRCSMKGCSLFRNPSPSFFFHSSFVCVACRAAVRWRWSHKHGIWPTDYSGTQWMAGEDQAPAKAFFLYYLHTHTQKKCSSLPSTQPLRENYPLYEKPVGWISPDSLHLSSSRMLNNHKPWTKTTTRR